MPRPIKRRTSEGYESEIQSLQRLRTAILLDRSLPLADFDIKTPKLQAISCIDTLCELLMELMELSKEVVSNAT